MSWLSGKPKIFEMLLVLASGREMKVTLIRGPLWPGDEPPPGGAEESEDGIIRTAYGDFGSITELAVFYGCVIDYDRTEYVESN